jgi:hypothetical protein
MSKFKGGLFQYYYGDVNFMLHDGLTLGGGILELIAYISDGINEGMFRVFYLAAQPADVDVDRAVAAVIIVTPDFVEQCFTRKNLSLIGGQQFQ